MAFKDIIKNNKKKAIALTLATGMIGYMGVKGTVIFAYDIVSNTVSALWGGVPSAFEKDKVRMRYNDGRGGFTFDIPAEDQETVENWIETREGCVQCTPHSLGDELLEADKADGNIDQEATSANIANLVRDKYSTHYNLNHTGKKPYFNPVVPKPGAKPRPKNPKKGSGIN